MFESKLRWYTRHRDRIESAQPRGLDVIWRSSCARFKATPIYALLIARRISTKSAGDTQEHAPRKWVGVDSTKDSDLQGIRGVEIGSRNRKAWELGVAETGSVKIVAYMVDCDSRGSQKRTDRKGSWMKWGPTPRGWVVSKTECIRGNRAGGFGED